MVETLWKIAGQTLDLSARSLIMGVLNVAPDSFSDGGEFFNTNKAIEQGQRMAAEGAHALVLATAWEEFRSLDLARLRRSAAYPVIVDGRNALDDGKLVAAGFEVHALGRPSMRSQP